MAHPQRWPRGGFGAARAIGNFNSSFADRPERIVRMDIYNNNCPVPDNNRDVRPPARLR
jgi:hypothetical protein